MLILDVMETCKNPGLSSFLALVKNVLLIIQIVVPITLLIAGTIEFTRLSINPEDKKGFRKILNKLIAAFIIFAIPFLINMVMGLVGESTEFTNCWNNASFKSDPGSGTYIETENQSEDTPKSITDVYKKN